MSNRERIGLLSNFRNRNSAEFFNNIIDEENFVYVFIGRTTPWNESEDVPDVKNTLSEEKRIWDDINGIKRIQPDDVAVAFRRINWQANRIFDEYDDGVDLSKEDFYVVTEDSNVYKCISNNNRSPSTIQPTHTTFDVSNEADGYKWKFMFSIPESLSDKFIAPEFVPLVIDEDVIEFASPGTVDNVKIDEAGSGYTPNANVDTLTEIPVFIQGDGDQEVSAEALITTSDGRVITTSVLDGGDNYPFAPESRIPLALRQITDDGITQTAYGIGETNEFGQIDSFNIVIQGSDYVNGTAQIVQSSARAYAETDFEGKIINADVFTGREGRNFNQAEAILVDESISEDNECKLRPIISPLEGHGSDPQKEVFANFVMINLRLAGDETFIELDDFRRIGLIEDPREYGDTVDSNGDPQRFEGNIGDTRTRIILDSNNSEFESDEVLYGESSGARGNELTLLNNDILRVLVDRSLAPDIEFEVNETVRGLSSGATGTISDIQNPDIERFSGSILFINNTEPVVREFNLQLETVTLVIEY